MKTTEQTLLLSGKPVTIIGKAEQRGQVWIETSAGQILRVHRSGLGTPTTGKPIALSNLRIDTSHGTDGAR